MKCHEVAYVFNSLRPNDAIWWQRSGLILVHVILVHYLNQYWLIISEAQQTCFDVWGISILMCRHWKLSGFYQNKVGFWPDFADIKHDYTQEFYQSYSSVISKCLEDRLVSQCLNVKLPSDECQCTSVTFISGQFLMRCPTFKIPSKSPKTHNHQNHFVFCLL